MAGKAKKKKVRKKVSVRVPSAPPDLSSALEQTESRARAAERRLQELEERLADAEAQVEYSEQRAETAEKFALEHADAESNAILLRLMCQELETELREVRERADKAEQLSQDYEELAEDAEERAYLVENALRDTEERAREAERRAALLEKKLSGGVASGSPTAEFPDRAMLLSHLEVALRQGKRYKRRVVLLSFAIPAVPELLGLVSARISRAVRETDIPGWIDPTTMGIILTEQSPEEDVLQMAEAVASRARTLLSQPFSVSGQNYAVRAVFGASLFPRDARLAGQMLEQAVSALDLPGPDAITYYGA